MRFSIFAASSLFAVLAAASSENVTVEDLFIRDNNGIQSAGLTILPANVTCSGNATQLAGYAVASCGDSVYSFAVNGSDSVYSLRIYEAKGVGFGLYGEVTDLPVNCRAGGDGQDDEVCNQVGTIEATISSG
ncbi:hypothetical protein LSUE1_G002116 [Lachnellula suecica]|uniref:AA1-like domain-containing protein n=1 Tax=Lachnellula suecica TaxID=602035 RepID=A0A8T9CG51_9HELO|nr:hypothetical protein LSUE1_G002116 [Lachnellula suecica]